MLQFVRQIPIRIVIQGTLSSRRGFLFSLAAGFSKKVDPLTGMSVNLSEVDKWLVEAENRFSGFLSVSDYDSIHDGIADWVQAIQSFLSEKAKGEGAILSSLTLREERGWEVSWNLQLPEAKLLFTYSHYLEVFPAKERFDLLKVNFTWMRRVGCTVDCQHEGFKILKAMKPQDVSSLENSLKQVVGKCVGEELTSDSTKLHSVQIEFLGEKYKLEFP